jgi:hypothetical protein
MLEYKFNGPLSINPRNPRYFTDNSGKSIYLTGSHTWAVMTDMWLENKPCHRMDYDGFIQMMEDYGHNFLRFWQYGMHIKNAPWSDVPTIFDPGPFERTGPGLANDGLPRFDLTKWNESYFKRMRERVIKAGQKGIYVSIMFFEAWALKWANADDDPWPYYPFNPSNNINSITDDPVIENGRAWDIFSLKCPQILEVQKAYIRKVVDTVNDLDNVLYEICNEVPNRKESMDWSEYLCAYTKEYEATKPKQHPVGITAEGGDQDNSELFATNADWVSPGNGRIFEYRYNPPAADGSKIILNDTDHLWGHGGEVAWIWRSFTRGMNVLFMDPWEPIPGDLDWWQDGNVTRNQRYYYAWDDIRRNLGYTRKVSLMFDLNRCVPNDHLCTSTYCLAHPGRQYVCYCPAGGYEGIDLIAYEGEFFIQWLNPSTGIMTKCESVYGGKRLALRAPFDGPSVLLLYKEKDNVENRRKIYYSTN